MDQNTGKYIVLMGIGVIIIGLLIYFLHDKLHWMGRLPGDVRIGKENSRLFFPFTIMLLISLFLTLIINLIKKFL